VGRREEGGLAVEKPETAVANGSALHTLLETASKLESQGKSTKKIAKDVKASRPSKPQVSEHVKALKEVKLSSLECQELRRLKDKNTQAHTEWTQITIQHEFDKRRLLESIQRTGEDLRVRCVEVIQAHGLDPNVYPTVDWQTGVIRPKKPY
jgi:hypothetical protein